MISCFLLLSFHPFKNTKKFYKNESICFFLLLKFTLISAVSFTFELFKIISVVVSLVISLSVSVVESFVTGDVLVVVMLNEVVCLS